MMRAETVDFCGVSYGDNENDEDDIHCLPALQSGAELKYSDGRPHTIFVCAFELGSAK